MNSPGKAFLIPVTGQISMSRMALVLLMATGLAACSRDDVAIPDEQPLATGSATQPDKIVKKDQQVKQEKAEKIRNEMRGEWQLVAIDERKLSQGGTPTVVFGDEGNCWGSTGLNSFQTTFTLEGPGKGKVKLGNAAVTRKAGPPEAMALENLFLDRFESASSYKVEGDTLHLYSGKEQNLTFRRIY